jgi:sugar phosphate isomerase/epimerase
MASPNVTFSTAAFFARPLDDIFGLVADAGYRGVEVMVTKEPASQDARTMRRLARAHGLTIAAIHAPCLLLTRKVWGSDPVGKISRAVQVAEEAGASVVVVHPPYRWQRDYRRWLDETYPTLPERTGVTVAVENMFPVHLAGRPMTFHANQTLDDLAGYPHLAFDTSHAAVASHDLLAVRRRLNGRIRHVHLSDNAGKGWDSHLPPGEGVLPIDEFLMDLADDGFEGAVSLEVDLRRYLTDPPRLRETLVAMRERCELALAPADDGLAAQQAS